jgi:hypothetical protein
VVSGFVFVCMNEGWIRQCACEMMHDWVGNVKLLQSDRGGERGMEGGMWMSCEKLNRRCSDRVGSLL